MINEEDQRSDETELYINLNINHNLTETDNKNIDVKSQLQHQIQIQLSKESGWIFDKSNSMKKILYEINGSSYVKIPLRSSALKNIKNDGKLCFIWSISAKLHPYENDHPNRVSHYREFFDELDIEGFGFTNGFKGSDVQEFEKLNNLSFNIYELNFYENQNKWKHYLIPIEISKNDESVRVIDLLIYKNHYALIKKSNVFSGDYHKSFICRRCLKSYTSENMLMIQKPKCENINKTTIRTSPESYIRWKKYFHYNSEYTQIFEADNEIHNSGIANKTTNVYKQNPVLNGFHIQSEVQDVLKSCYYKSPLGYNNVDWLVDKVIKLEKR